ncbi:MAG: isopentenyl-diphosphate delta-isomerase [Candidatus Levybacteria bacterium RIFCSPHIGHO2_02_FULL_37_10]|nr:MAG: isopentenyl-diphosphate delta-isomerase [Candidatus Levybacteria bacterium RIFCSPHIGHO2_02_FULL_37_10]OGH41623.1 MAG: isopentenyl-diphosphate delta-isomerase [Candidatus Levybacteria bacterium RIFCSPLOWO2_02_FULL_36_8b]
MEKIEEYVVLVDKNNNVLGTAPKLESHNKDTPLHRAFSLFLFSSKGEILLQQRSKNKKTWPLIWSNSCCGHPKLNETNTNAVKRRVKFELGIELNEVHEILPDFSYKAEMDGIVENEICPVFIGFTDNKPVINKEEIENIKWVEWNDFLNTIKQKPGTYSVWCKQEAKLLAKNKEFLKIYKQYAS